MNNKNNNNYHHLSTIAIMAFAVLYPLYVESKPRTPEERHKLYLFAYIIITATLLNRSIIEASTSRRSIDNQPKELPQTKSAFLDAKDVAKERNIDINIDNKTIEEPAIK